jgi:TolB-like protein/class 3 adenylate cyclase/Tfp pilus assembly protein PilF
MADEGFKRKLTAILSADVAGYSRLMAEDESSTVKTLATYREVISSLIKQHRGRVVDSPGDNVLAEFSSVVDAVQCAVAVQNETQTRNTALPANRRMEFRIGINLGDVIEEDERIYGDGVNIAARVEGLSAAGGIAISGTVFEHIKDKLSLGYHYLGEQNVKNIPEPVRVYQILTAPEAAGKVIGEEKIRAKKLRWAAVSALVLIIVAVGVLAIWKYYYPTQIEPASLDKMAYPLPDKPSIAVLPFVNMSDDPKQEYFSDGITEDLITDLSKISGLFIISRNSTFVYKGKPIKIRQVAEELGVRYVLEGSVRRFGDRVRINVQVIEATTGGHIWAERYDGSLDDVFALQDKITAKIVEALALELMPLEVQRIGHIGTDNVAAHDAYLLGLSSYYRRTPKDNAKAATFFQQAIQLDPNYTAAYTALAKVYVQAVIGEHAYAEKLGIFWTHGYTKAWRLLEKGMAKPNADFHVLRSWLALKKHQHDRAITEAKQAIEINPNDADALEALAEALIFAGQPEAGIEYAKRAMRQNPTLLGRPLYLMGLAEFALGSAQRAIGHLEHAIREAPSKKADFSGILAAAYGELNRIEQAEAAFKSFGQGILNRPSMAWSVKSEAFANPRYHTWRRIDLAWSAYSFPFAERSVLERLVDGFKAAGAPESVGGYLPLHAANKLSGSEIKSLLFGEKTEGKGFWLSEFSWQQQRTDEGVVTHAGDPIHAGLPRTARGVGRIQDDLLCEQWPVLTKDFEICVVIFRVSDPNARLRWGEYVMVTDTGPHPFSLIQ